MKGLRSTLSEKERQEKSQLIQKRVIEHPLFSIAEEIYCYVSFGDEVETGLIMDNSWKMGKKLAVPKIVMDNFPPSECSAIPDSQTSTKKLLSQSMEFFYINSRDELKEGYYGILEPVTARKAEGRNILVILPGVAFDLQRNRVGYGKGFYDSYLKQHPDYRRIALAYSIQCIDYIPADIHDIRPELILTESEIF